MATSDYRRELTRSETLRTLAAGAGAGVAAALAVTYLARVLLQRTPLKPDRIRSAPAVEALLPARRSAR